MQEDLSQIATSVVYEDDHVRVWNQVVPAGGAIAKHEHTNDYFLVNVSGNGPIQVQFHEGSGGALGETLEFSPQPKTADFVKRGHIETARNSGDEYRAILVEFKR